MKKLMITTAIFCIFLSNSFAQDSKPLFFKTSAKGIVKVSISTNSSLVSIEGYDGNEIVVEATNPPVMPEEAAGLRPISAAGNENTGIGLAAVTSGNVLTFTTVLKNTYDKITTYKFRVPKNLNIAFKQGNGWMGYYEAKKSIKVSDIDGEIDVNVFDAPIEIVNVSGPIIANATNGNIKVVFDNKMMEKPCSFVTYDGNVDITLSEQANVGFSINHNYGSRANVFTDLDLKNVEATPQQKTTITGQLEMTGDAEEDKKKIEALDKLTEQPVKTVDISPASASSPAEKVSTTARTKITGQTIEPATAYTFAKGTKLNYTIRNEGKPGPNYILNEVKTHISIRTGNGNVFLRKKK